MASTTIRRGSRLVGAGLVAMDQAVASLANLGFVLVAAHLEGGTRLGEFAVLFAVYIVILGFSRAFVTDVRLFGLEDRIAAEWADRGALSAGLIVGLVSGLAGMIASLVLGFSGEMASAVAVWSLALPAVLFLDVLRVQSLIVRDYRQLLNLDTIWFVLQFVPSLILLWLGQLTLELALLLWGVSALVSAYLRSRKARTPIRLGLGLNWLRVHLRKSSGLLLDFMAGQGVLQATILVIAVTVTASGAGYVRLVQAGLGVTALLVQGAQSFVAPRMAANPRLRRPRVVVQVAIALSAVAAVWCSVLLALPLEVSTAIFGASWEVIPISVVLILGLERCVASFAAPYTWVIRSSDAAGRLGIVRAVSGAIGLCVIFFLSSFYGVVGASVGLLSTTLVASSLILALAAIVGFSRADPV